MGQEDSRSAFVSRLGAALTAAGYDATPTTIAKGFNLRAPENSVTVQAARKWILGESFPSDDKLLALASWLDVDPAWLRFGETTRPSVDAPGDSLQRDLALLTPAERRVMRNMLDLLLEARKKD
jgi:hypothetical protein